MEREKNCLDENLVSGFVEGSLDEPTRARVLEHLSWCAACRAWVAELSDALDVHAVARKRVPPWRWLAAAVVLIAAGALLMTRGGRKLDDATLSAAASLLRASDPEVFGEFRPLAAPERGGANRTVYRGGIALIEPTESVLTHRPGFRWRPVPNARSYRLLVRDASGGVLFRHDVTATEFDWPKDVDALPAGSYVWRMTTLDTSEQLSGVRAFRILDDAARDRYERGLEIIDTRIDEALRRTLRAHWAIRNGLYREAVRQIESGSAMIERETLGYVRRALGEGTSGN